MNTLVRMDKCMRNQHICAIIHSKFAMKEEHDKKRGRLSSEAITSAEEHLHLKSEAVSCKEISPKHKPQEDPDAPP